MNLDFAAVIVLLTALSGLIWAVDALAFAPRRRAAAGVAGTGGGQAVPTPLLVDYARSFFPIFLIVLVLRSFLVEPFRIPSGSMMPTLLIGDFILVNKFTYGIRLPVINAKVIDVSHPQRGDIVVFRYPEDPATPFIKRIVGLPGDRVAYYDKTLYINGKPLEYKAIGPYTGVGAGEPMSGALLAEEFIDSRNHQILVMPERPSREVEAVIPEGEYFVLGDNRDNSKDSRYWGTVPDENLIGKAFVIWMNWDSRNGGVEWSRLGQTLR